MLVNGDAMCDDFLKVEFFKETGQFKVVKLGSYFWCIQYFYDTVTWLCCKIIPYDWKTHTAPLNHFNCKRKLCQLECFLENLTQKPSIISLPYRQHVTSCNFPRWAGEEGEHAFTPWRSCQRIVLWPHSPTRPVQDFHVTGETTFKALNFSKQKWYHPWC